MLVVTALAAPHRATTSKDDIRLAASAWGATKKGSLHSHTMRSTGLPKDGLVPRWRARLVPHLERLCALRGAAFCENRDVYEFGVYTGGYMRGLALELNTSGRVPFRKLWGFDSFQGLPSESETTRRTRVSESEWWPGAYSAAEVFRDHSLRSVQARLRSYIDDARVDFVAGYYNQSLTSTLRQTRDMRPALYVDIDCDLYISTAQALQWMQRSGLLEPAVTIIGYDDWFSGGLGGERRAHTELASRHNLSFARLDEQLFQLL